ncbi:MAG: hypothetical protein Roseis2KO_35930 [Roseivirga sp.]
MLSLEAVLRDAIFGITEEGYFTEHRTIYFDTLADYDFDLAKSRIIDYRNEMPDSTARRLLHNLATDLNFENSEYMPVMNTLKSEEFEFITDPDRIERLGVKSDGLLRVSNIELEGDLGCFYLAFYCGKRCLGSGNVVFLIKEQGQWSIELITPLWSSRPISGPGTPVN